MRNPEKSDLESLVQSLRLEWVKACRWEGWQSDDIYRAKFAIFSPDNPYMQPGSKYDKLIGILQNYANNRRYGLQNPVENRQYQAFHGNPPSRARRVKMPVPIGPMTAIGRAVRIEYEPYGNSRHKGTRFFHNFGDLGERTIKERPLLVSDRKGDIFFIPQHPKYPHYSERGILG